MALCVAPPYFRGAPKPRRKVVVEETDLHKAEKLSLLEARMKLTADIDHCNKDIAESTQEIQNISEDVIPPLEKEQARMLETIVTVAAFKERTVERLTQQAIEASLTGDFRRSRATMRTLDMVTDRLRQLWENVDRIRNGLVKAHKERDELAQFRIPLLHLKIADTAAQVARLGTWAWMYYPIPKTDVPPVPPPPTPPTPSSPTSSSSSEF